MNRRLVLDEPEEKRPKSEDEPESPRRLHSPRRPSGKPGRQRYFKYNPPQSRQELERRKEIRGNYSYKKHPEIARDCEEKLKREDKKRSYLSSVRKSTNASSPVYQPGNKEKGIKKEIRGNYNYDKHLEYAKGSHYKPRQEDKRRSYLSSFQRSTNIFSLAAPSVDKPGILGPAAVYESKTNLKGSPRLPTRMASEPFSSDLVMGPSRSLGGFIKEEFGNCHEGVTSTRSYKLPSEGSRPSILLGPGAVYESNTNLTGSPRPPTQKASEPFSSGLVVDPPRSLGRGVIKEEFSNCQEGVTSTRSYNLPSGGPRSIIKSGPASAHERTVKRLCSPRPSQMGGVHPFSSGPVMGPGGVFWWPSRNHGPSSFPFFRC